MNPGIDYGMGQANIDLASGIRFGVIPAHHVGQSWYDASEAEYGDPTCPECGKVALASDAPELEKHEGAEWFNGKDYTCEDCEYCFWSDEAFGDEPSAHSYFDEGYQASQGTDGDIFVTMSPFYTYAPFCSPCAPGACYLPSAVAPNEVRIGGLPRVYCFGHEWFEDGIAPYRVFRVNGGTEVFPDAR